MKRILIVNNNMHIGGVQKALLNLLQTLHADYDITLLLFYCGGALLNEVPTDVRVCAAGGAFRYFGMTKNDVSTVRDRLLRAFWAGVTRVLGMPFSTWLACLLQKRIQGFDAAISFLHSGAAHTFTAGAMRLSSTAWMRKRRSHIFTAITDRSAPLRRIMPISTGGLTRSWRAPTAAGARF